MDKKQADFTGDPHWGRGGRYVIDASGKRVPAPPVEEETAPAGEAVPAQTGTRPDNAESSIQNDAQGLAPVGGESKAATGAYPVNTTKEKKRA